VKIIYRDWWIEHLPLMAQEDSTKTKESPRHFFQSSDDENDDDENDTGDDQTATSSEEDGDEYESEPNYAQILFDSSHAMGFLAANTSSEEEEEEDEDEVKCTLSPRAHRYSRRSKLHLALMFLLTATVPADANNAFGTASYLPTLDDAAPLDASNPLPTPDANSIILVLILLVVTCNATKSSANTRNRIMTSTCAMIADYTKPQYAQSYTDHLDRIFKPIFVEDVNKLGYRTKDSFGIQLSSTQGTCPAPYSALLGWLGYWPHSVDITATFILQGIEYEWRWYATDVAHAMAIARFTERVHGRTDPNADGDYDFTSLIGGRWVAVNPLLEAKDLTNDEAVHMAALQTLLQKVADGSWIIDDDDHPIDRWLSKRSWEEREELLDAYVQQAQVEGNFDIIIEYIKGAADKFGKRENDLTGDDLVFARPVSHSYFFEVPEHGFKGNADPPLALNCSNQRFDAPDLLKPPLPRPLTHGHAKCVVV
jgi:hypothetical protein